MSLQESGLLSACVMCIVETTYYSLERLFDLVLNAAFVSLSGLLLGCHSDIVA